MGWRKNTSDIAGAALPPGALLARYEAATGYTDCFVATVPGQVTHGAYVEAFYTTALFKLERIILAVLLSRPSSDREVRGLVTGEASRFAAWTVEAREPNQILLCDFLGASRSWLMSEVDPASPKGATTLYFGTALVPSEGTGRLGIGFRAMIPFHRLYARALLRSAVRRLKAA